MPTSTSLELRLPLKSGCLLLPHVFVRELMPQLSDTAFRVLLVIADETLGWQGEEGGRKGRAWISTGSFEKKTGRSAKAVSQAISDLLGKGLIAVTDEAGKALDSASERQRYGGKLYFGFSSSFQTALAASNPRLSTPSEESAVKNLHHNKESQRTKSLNKGYNFRLYGSVAHASLVSEAGKEGATW